MLVLLCGAAWVSACRRAEETSSAVEATSSEPSAAKQEPPPNGQSADTATGKSDDAAAAGKTMVGIETATGEAGAVKRDDNAEEESEGVDAKAPEPTGAPGGESADPSPTPVDDLKMVVTESGLKYWDIQVGDGEIPEPNGKVKARWRAWFTDGRVLDDSASLGSVPFYARTGVVDGFYEGVWSMRVGGIRRLELSPELGWGEKGKPPVIPPNTTMIIEVELLDTIPRRRQAPFEHLQVVTTPSGLKYWDLKVGDGARPELRSTAEMHYAVWLDDGTLIADTLETKIPPKIRTDMLPAGWTEGLSTMAVGGKMRLEIPADLGYGTKGEPFIPANVGLVMEVELLGLISPEPWPPPPPIEGIEPITTPTGVIYWDLEEGYGRSPERAGTILVHLTAWLSDGRMYESSLESERRAELRLSEEVAGLAHGIRTMKIGGKRRLKIPPDLGYGESGRPGIVPPNETLILEVELFGFTD